MKKTILFAALALATTGLFAQKQTGGEKNLEVQFSPLGGSNVSISGLRFRMFNTEASALRLSFFVGGSSTETVQQEADNDIDALELLDTDKEFSFSIRPGYEKHFEGTDRLSPYVGAELSFTSTSTTTEDQEQYIDEDGDPQVQTTTTKGGTSSFGLNLLAGTDFYFADNIYLGAEIGFGFASSKDKDNETTFENAPDGFEDTTSTVGNEKSNAWGPNYQATLRLGWLFN